MADHHLRKEVERAHLAELINTNVIFIEAKEQVLTRLRETWESTAITQCEEREKLWLMLVTAKELFEYVDDVVKTGELAQLEIERNDHGQ